MAEVLPAEPIGLDKHDPAGMARWLRERSEAAHEFLALDGEAQQRQYLNRWQQNVLPHLAFRFEQAAEMIERLAAGEHICTKCYLRMLPFAKDSDSPEPDPLF
jgi:hypothetical protein